ncbi:MAG TPA: M20/M25/M40 family metallo-hydrolase [Negativicutes bacterium]|nr:M20/M25/M40 family metallo-hydrolase [Negativicutes bacterium]
MDKGKLLALVRDLAALPGGAGREQAVAAYMAGAFRRYTDRVDVDAVGNVFACFGDGERKVMVSAHTDEVGLFVKYINDQGFIYFEANGIIDERVLLDTKVELVAGAGAVHVGVIGIKSRHLMTPEELARPVNIGDLWIDVGADSDEEVAALGIRVGDPIVYRRHFDLLAGGRFTTKAIDDRAGCAVLLALAEALAAHPLPYTLCLVATTQEEIGSRGAKVAAQRLNPDLALTLDTVPAADPYTPPQQSAARLGGGPVIRTADFLPHVLLGTVYSAKIVRRLLAVAAAEDIPCQEDVFRTWTDAAYVAYSGTGVPSGGVYMPRRCSHAPVEVADINDIANTAALLDAFLRRLTAEEIEELAKFL